MPDCDNLLLLTGLGNPGKQYQDTRHNLGFAALEELVRRVCSDLQWRQSSEVAQTAEIVLDGRRCILLKPLTYMNLSGQAVAEIFNYYKLAGDQLMVAHDDIDLPLGTLRIRKGGGDGGHRGVRSIIDSLGQADFGRLRLGVGRPQPASDRPPLEVSDWVLTRFSAHEVPVVQEMLARAAQALEMLATDGLERAQSRFNGAP